jgi:hypothetical protein
MALTSQYDEFGEVGGPGTLSASYGQKASYQQPRTVRLGARYTF